MSNIELIDFYADWCGPCQIMKPIIKEIEKELKNVKITKINVDENQKEAQKYNVMSIPTFVIRKDGKIIDQLSGVLTKKVLVEKLK
ncbi:thioredoxin [Candidatus Berkelbacteria bacterium CG_4_8_14_3_um_filter_33_6]|nr:MAG: thioredoxin [Candidatus Berkelbacteria bacterium CG23_combo_of_CG06-09_8_20_14_all_33_15]PIX31190.1 MAG: thioredoxin [Candidatus Berkelbacteria bacterium CG_4_8_14_3_um_filter_33_6]PIZ28269.1 MAG: thioredoxin [Candidatus Berkelbacteria bacterium CG_4_10_14_0_8_um_filter_35_9_33_8]PJB51801.1 MAG: thioredoxin [Candidatus Berkelbacteria bacterium CG_4_9_14_3_um_filter_33_5]